MKKTTLALLLAAVTAMPAVAQDFAVSNDTGATKDKSGFALTGGMLSYDSKWGDALEEMGGSKNVFQLGADYTFSQGFILGATTTSMQETDHEQKFGEASFVGGYELDCGVRLKAGVAYLVHDDERETGAESGYTLGLGYVFDNGIIVEGAYTDIDFKGFQYGSTAISVGYKF